MNNLIQENQEQKMKGIQMERLTQSTEEKKLSRKFGTAYQQNLIELIGYIYANQNEHTYYSLAKEMSKSKRAIQRMITDINVFCPYIFSSINKIDGCAYLKIKNICSEKDLDRAYQKLQNAPLLYIFLKSLFIKPVSITEITEKVRGNKKAAKNMIKKIFEATPYGNFVEEDENMIF